MRLFSLLYIAASHTVHSFSCVLVVVSYTYIYMRVYVCVCVCWGGGEYISFNTLSLIFFSINVENVGECCKAQ